jgi:hypothetical protein
MSNSCRGFLSATSSKSRLSSLANYDGLTPQRMCHLCSFWGKIFTNKTLAGVCSDGPVLRRRAWSLTDPVKGTRIILANVSTRSRGNLTVCVRFTFGHQRRTRGACSQSDWFHFASGVTYGFLIESFIPGLNNFRTFSR